MARLRWVTALCAHPPHAATVTVGGRNAEIVNVDEHAVQIRVPPLPVGPDTVAIGVVTGRGATTRENALAVESELESFWRAGPAPSLG